MVFTSIFCFCFVVMFGLNWNDIVFLFKNSGEIDMVLNNQRKIGCLKCDVKILNWTVGLKIYISWWQREFRKENMLVMNWNDPFYLSPQIFCINPGVTYALRFPALVICEVSVFINLSFHWPYSACLFLYCHKNWKFVHSFEITEYWDVYFLTLFL